MTKAALPLIVAALACWTPRVAQGQDQERIAWFGTWSSAQAAAKKTGRPIFLVAAAPHCHNISGLW